MCINVLVRFRAESPPFGKELLIRLLVCFLCIMLCLLCPIWFREWDCGSDCATSWSFLTIYYSGFREEDFSNVFSIYGRSGHLGHVTMTIYINLVLGISCVILLRHYLDIPYNHSFPLPMDFPHAIVL